MSEPAKEAASQRHNTAARSTRPPSTPRVDISSPAYKQAASKFTRFIVAMPILLVTSYFLFGRLALGRETKSLPGSPATEEGKKA